MANTYLSRTQGTATLGRKYTFSCWIKRSKITDRQQFIRTTGYGYFEFQADDKLHYYDVATGGDLVTNRVFRDTNSWYHIVLSVDTTLTTADDRHKIYVNGVQETSFSDRTNPTQNNGGYFFDDGRVMYIGTNEGSNLFFNGCISHLHGIDGTAYDASAFGETDTTTGEWKGKTSPSVTYGNNGFFILKDGNGITDQSGEGNDFTLGGGTLTDLKDNPDNVFATWNPLDNQIASSTFSNGNNTIVTNSGSFTWNTSTLGVASGKWYWEILVNGYTGTVPEHMIGIASKVTTDHGHYLGSIVGTVCYADGGASYVDGSSASYGNSYTTNDIIGVALDMDNSKIYFSKNGTFQNSGVPTSGSTGTGALSISASSTGFYFPAVGDYHSAGTSTLSANFGNGYFGTTAVSSAGTNASDNGIFEYDVPTGYTALSTKGLNL